MLSASSAGNGRVSIEAWCAAVTASSLALACLQPWLEGVARLAARAAALVVLVVLGTSKSEFADGAITVFSAVLVLLPAGWLEEEERRSRIRREAGWRTSLLRELRDPGLSVSTLGAPAESVAPPPTPVPPSSWTRPPARPGPARRRRHHRAASPGWRKVHPTGRRVS